MQNLNGLVSLQNPNIPELKNSPKDVDFNHMTACYFPFFFPEDVGLVRWAEWVTFT